MSAGTMACCARTGSSSSDGALIARGSDDPFSSTPRDALPGRHPVPRRGPARAQASVLSVAHGASEEAPKRGSSRAGVRQGRGPQRHGVPEASFASQNAGGASVDAQRVTVHAEVPPCVLAGGGAQVDAEMPSARTVAGPILVRGPGASRSATTSRRPAGTIISSQERAEAAAAFRLESASSPTPLLLSDKGRIQAQTFRPRPARGARS